MSFRRALVSMLGISLVACAGDDEPAGTAEAPERSPEAEEAHERCSAFAARLCASAADCCASTTTSFSAEACAQSYVRDVCLPASQAVGAGIATYDPDVEEPCLEAWARAHATCVVDWQEILEIRRDVWSACKMVRGTYEPGSGCSTSVVCAQPDGPATARCLPGSAADSSRDLSCRILEILEEGATCLFPNGDVSVCNTGLYCTAHERDAVGTCAPVVPEGRTCDTSIAENSECGLGSYCGTDDGVCHRAVNLGGPSCARGDECVSFRCDRANGVCNEAPTTATDLCARGAG